MTKKLYIFLLVILGGLIETNIYTMQELSDSDFSPSYRPVLTGITTNGEIIIAGVNYSDDAGVTWKAFTGLTETAISIFISGNVVYKLAETGPQVFQVSSCNVSVNHIFVQIQSDIHVSEIGESDTDWIGWWVGYNGVNEFFAVFRIDETVPEINWLKFYKNDGGWANDFEESGSSGGIEPHPCIPVAYWDATSARFVFAAHFNGPTDATRQALISSWKPADDDRTAILLNDVDGGGNNLRLDFVQGDYDYVSKDHFLKTTDGQYYLSGELFDDSGVSQGVGLLKTNGTGFNQGWTQVSSKRIVPIAGTSPRLWGFINGSTEIYRSVNSGVSFSLVDDPTGRTWEGGVEITDSDIGFGAFDDAKFYTQQDALESFIRSADVVLEIQNHSRAEIVANVDWSTNRVLEAYDETPDLLFRGKSSNIDGFGSTRVYTFHGLDKKDLDAKVDLKFSTLTGIHTIAKAAIDFVNRTLFYDVTSIPDPSATTVCDYVQTPLRDILSEMVDLIDGVWYVEPAGKVWLLKIGSIIDAVNDKTQASGDCSSPLDTISPKQFNRVVVYGAGDLFSVAENTDSITENGVEELIMYRIGIDTQSQLDVISAATLARNGIATPPIDIDFIIRSQKYIQPGNFMGFQWTLIDRFSVNTDYVIKKVVFMHTRSVIMLLTNNTFQEGNRIEQ